MTEPSEWNPFEELNRESLARSLEGASEVRVKPDEIELLVRHHAERVLDFAGDWAYYGQAGGWATEEYAWLRIEYFASILGEDRVQAIVKNVFKDFDPPDVPGIFQADIDWEATAANGYFGDCPECRHNSGLLNVGPDYWYVCQEHKAKWPVPDGLLSNWREQPPEGWAAAILKLAEYREVKPIYPPHRTGLVVVREPPPDGDASAATVDETERTQNELERDRQRVADLLSDVDRALKSRDLLQMQEAQRQLRAAMAQPEGESEDEPPF
jgi:hypothetical protein